MDRFERCATRRLTRRAERSQRRERQGTVQMQAAEADRSGQLVVETRELTFAYDGPPVVRNLSTLITAGDKVGIIGPNGAGKTTLIKLLLGELQPLSLIHISEPTRPY